jgi:hypothetical protein
MILFQEKVQVRTASFNDAVSEITHRNKETASSSISKNYKRSSWKILHKRQANLNDF